MRIHRAWLSAVPVFLLAAACSDARTATGPVPQPARLEVVGTSTVPSDCQAKIDALIIRTQDKTLTPITGKNAEKDRAGLVGKLDEASSALSVGKNADAVQKLGDLVAKVEQLKAAGKLDAASAELLIAGANDAITCINAIGA